MEWTMIGTLIAGMALVGSFLVYISTKSFKLGSLVHGFDSVTMRIEKLENKVEKINDVVVANNDDLNTIKAILNMKYKKLDGNLTARHSPRVLNELGEKLFKEMNGQEILEQNKDAFFAKIDKEHPKAALDVESASKIACLSLISQDFFIPIKNFVYNCPLQDIPGTGGEKLDVDIETACYVLSIPLRDMYLEAHKEIATA